MSSTLADKVLKVTALLHLSGKRYVTRTELWYKLSRNNPNLKRPSLSCCISSLLAKNHLRLRELSTFPQQFYIPSEQMPFSMKEDETNDDLEISTVACKLLLLRY